MVDNPAIPNDISRDEMAEAGISGFFSIVKEWSLEDDAAQILLGNPSRSRFQELRKGNLKTCHSLSDDELDRLAYIVSIYSTLNTLYSPESHSEWLRNESKLPAEAFYCPWGIGSPLKYMLSGKLKALSDIYEFLYADEHAT